MKKSLLLLAVLITIMGCSLSTELSTEPISGISGSTSSVYDNAAVKLYYANTGYIVIGSAIVERWISGRVCLKNIAYTKEMVVHYSINGGAWQQKSYGRFGYLQAAPEPGKEVWWFNIDLPHVNYTSAWTGQVSEPWAAANVEFAVEYKVNGQTYWDNNNGQNYKISSRGINPQYSLVALGRSLVAQEAYVTPINGRQYYDKVQIAVANLGYNKTVQVLYTKDNWSTSSYLTAVYNGSSPDGTQDYFLADLPYNDGDQIKYAISYTVNGITTWDNNFGNDYQI